MGVEGGLAGLLAFLEQHCHQEEILTKATSPVDEPDKPAGLERKECFIRAENSEVLRKDPEITVKMIPLTGSAHVLCDCPVDSNTLIINVFEIHKLGAHG